jgi:hypothetical protein
MSKRWKHASSPPKKFFVQKSTEKVFASFFWDKNGIIFTDYIQQGKSMKRKNVFLYLKNQLLYKI